MPNFFYSAIIAAVVVVLWIIAAYNRGIRLKNYVQEAFSTMDIYLKKRWDLIPNLLETTKGYAKHEKELLEEVTKLRNQNYADIPNNEKIEVNSKLTLGLSRLFAVAENYPDLKASENFRRLAEELSSIEGEIATARKYYNGTARELNNFLERFPTNLIGVFLHFTKAPFFEISEAHRENVKVQF